MEGPQRVGAANRDRADGHAGLQREVADAVLQRPQRPTARVAALGKYQHHAATLEHLVDGAEYLLIELSPVRRDGQDANARRQSSLPCSVDDGLAPGHRVAVWPVRIERDEEGR